MHLLILSAGYATRLSPLTDNQTKSLLPINGRAILDHIIDRFDSPISTTIVTNSKFAHDFERWVKTSADVHLGWQFSILDDLSTNENNRRGAVGDIQFAIESLNLDDDLIVVAGDNLFTESLNDFVLSAKSDSALVGVYDVGNVDLARQFGCVSVEDGRIVSFEEKPREPKTSLISVALYYFPRQIIPTIKQYLTVGNSPDHLGGLIKWLITRVQCCAYPIRGHWFDIGDLKSYNEAQRLVL